MKKKRKKLRFKGLIFLLLLFYLIGSFVYYLFTFPVKNIIINGNNNVPEGQIIQSLNLDKKTPMVKVNKSYIKKHIKDINLIDNFTLKRSITGKITINITEAKLLFIYNNKIILSNEKQIENSNNYLGIPTLINYTPEDVYKNLIKAFAKIDNNIIYMISEIEYTPDTYNDAIIDKERFAFYMNDGNKVYINNVNMDKINKYGSVLDTIESTGILYLDSSSNNYIFKHEEE